jgi:hypothetical protein
MTSWVCCHLRPDWPGRLGRLSSLASRTAASRPAASYAAYSRLSDRADRGTRHLLGRRPPQAPRLLGPARGPAQPPRGPRPRLARGATAARTRPRRLVVSPQRARGDRALRPRPARRPSHPLSEHDVAAVWVILGLAAPFGLGVAIGGSIGAGLTGLLWGGAVRVFVLHHVTYSINSLCHVYGRRRFQTGDHPRNLAWLSPASLGEAWQDNHHASPTSAIHGLNRVEIDPLRARHQAARAHRTRLGRRANRPQSPSRPSPRLTNRAQLRASGAAASCSVPTESSSQARPRRGHFAPLALGDATVPRLRSLRVERHHAAALNRQGAFASSG